MPGKNTTTVITNTDSIVEVRTVWVDEEAYVLLASGDWILLHGGIAHKDMGGFQAKPCHVMGRLK